MQVGPFPLLQGHCPESSPTCIAYDQNVLPKDVDGVCNQHDMLVPLHQLPFPSGSPNNQAIRAVINLDLHQVVVRIQVKFATGRVGGFDGGDDPGLPQQLPFVCSMVLFGMELWGRERQCAV